MAAKYTPEGLPVVSKDNYESLIGIWMREWKRAQKKPTVEDVLVRRLEKDNPLIMKVVSGSVRSLGEGEFCDGLAFGVAMTYELLRRQSEANKLEKGE